MLNSKYRFHSRGGVRHAYKNGKTIRHPKLSLVYSPNERGFLRFGVVISKKVLKSAVGRNRIRRRIYEALRLELPALNLQSGDFLFVIYQADIINMDFTELRQLISSLISNSMI